MDHVSRRQLLIAGSAATAIGLLGEEPVMAEDSPHPTAVPVSPVRMVGDALGLTPRETAAVLEDLASEGPITPDWYSVGGAVDELERQFALELGKECAIFMPTGTLANHLAVRALAAGQGRAIVQAESHLYNDAGDCVQRLSGIPLIPLGVGRRDFTLTEVQRVVDRTATRRVPAPVSVISIETPVRRRSGETFDQAELDRITAYARGEGIRLHLDGARLFLQGAYTGTDVATLSRPFDTVYVSLYKYFNAASGAILAGPAALLDDMFHARRMFGSGLPAAWPFAAVALNFLPGFIDRFTAAVRTSESLVTELGRHDAFRIERMTGGTNLFRLRVSGVDAEAFRHRLRQQEVDLGGVRADGSFTVGVNETWNRATPDALAARFRAALA